METTIDKRFIAENDVDALKPCQILKPGQVFYVENRAKPDGLCNEAWRAINEYVFALSHGIEDSLFYYGDLTRTHGITIISCNDGLHPVTFKMETTER